MNLKKIHPNISIQTAIHVDLSADQWRLKTDQFPRTVIEQVASFMNKRLMMDFNRGESKEKLKERLNILAEDFTIYGATSPQTQKVLDNLLKQVYC